MYHESAITYSSAALEKSKQLATAASHLLCLMGVNNNAGNLYLQVHDSATTPADTAVPILSFIIFPGANFFFDRTMLEWPFSKGIYICASTTLATKTLAATNDLFLMTQHIQIQQ